MSDHSITSLIEKLEGAEGPSLVLDGEIWCAVNGYTFVMWDGAGCVYRRASDGGISHEQASRIRPFSASLDTALALAELVGWRVYTIDMSVVGRPSVMLQSLDDRPGTDAETGAHMIGKDYSRATAKTPALALCASILRAHQHDN